MNKIKMPDIIKIAGIPTAIVDNHNEVLRYWKGRNRTLFHIDAHSDMGGEIPYYGKHLKDYYDKVSIANFICVATHFKIVSDVYWLNPHSEETRLQYFGDEEHSIETKLGLPNHIKWKLNQQMLLRRNMYNHNVDIKGDFILDIDLDAFSCITGFTNGRIPEGHDSEQGYEKRIQQTMETLVKLKYPKIITIARSRGFLESDGSMAKEFVPSKFQYEVEQLTLKGLKGTYE